MSSRAEAGSTTREAPAGHLDDECLGDVVGRDAERLRLRERALRVRVREELVAHSGLVEHARHV
jgi:hypothetical protein